MVVDKYIATRDNMELELKQAKGLDKFQLWLFEQIQPYLFGTILEIGSGLGANSDFLIRRFKKNNIILSDIDERYVAYLRKHYKWKNIEVCKTDLTKKEDFKQISKQVDSIFAVNVLEHVEDDVASLKMLYSLLNKNGKLVLLIPAHQFLYNTIDENIGHFRRYNKAYIQSQVHKTKFKIKEMFYFNAVSMLGWYITGNILHKKEVKGGSLTLFNKLIPVIRMLEGLVLRRKVGISLVVVLEK